MTIRALASKIAKIEGKKSQSRIGDIREVLAILSDVMFDDVSAYQALAVNGINRAKKRMKMKLAA